MIKVDENEPIGEIELSFPYRDVQIKRNSDPKEEYTLEEEIGRGKFGTVYRCTEKSSGLNLAAKFIACPKKEDKRNVEREIDIMRQLQHPRLIQVYDAFENGKVMCVILELIEGGELFERVIDDDFILTEKACTIFMRQICEGIDFIHKQRILHLDMKPENILCLTKTGNRVKIIDFGLARKFDPSKKLQVLFGTPEFVAPEVVNFDEIGYGTDMWSVGVICYVLLSGLSPFMGKTDVETMANVTIGKYDFDDEAFDQISENAKDFIKKLLVKDLNSRLNAEECLSHPWLARRKTLPLRSSSMEVTKDNLRHFVERWNEHPNSPYVFEIDPCSLESPFSSEGTATSSSHSLVGDSPSPCGSIASSPGSDNAFSPENLLFLPTTPEHFRRASDSTCIVKKTDITERINLADEIKKLSDKLYRLASIDTSLINDQYHFDGDKPPLDRDKTTLNGDNSLLDSDKPKLDGDNSQLDIGSFKLEVDIPKIEEDKRVLDDDKCRLDEERPYIQRSVVNGFMSKILPKDHPENPTCGIPWRRTKFKVGLTSRDVPFEARSIRKSSHEFTTRTNGSFQSESMNDTKDLLLQLLEHWDSPEGPRMSRHSSVSNEWSETETLGQRTISSLNTFFQSRATNKKITPFHFNKS